MHLALVCFCFEAKREWQKNKKEKKERSKNLDYSVAYFRARRDALHSGHNEATHFSMEFYGCFLVLNVLAFYGCLKHLLASMS